MILPRRDHSAHPCLLIGQGPSAWPLEHQRGALEDLMRAGVVVGVCNRGYTSYPFTYCFAQDPVPCAELFSCRVYDHGILVMPDSAWLDWHHQGNEKPQGCEPGQNFYTLGAPSRTSTGVLAAQALIHCRTPSLTLVGFDGSSDGRNRYQGQDGYRTKPTRAPTYLGWESNLLSIVRSARNTQHLDPKLYHAPLLDAAHPLDRAFERVGGDLIEHLQREVETCRKSK